MVVGVRGDASREKTSSRSNVDQFKSSRFSENPGTLPEKRSRSRSSLRSCKENPSKKSKPGDGVYSRSKSIVVGSSRARLGQFKPLHGILKPSGRSREKHKMNVRYGFSCNLNLYLSFNAVFFMR